MKTIHIESKLIAIYRYRAEYCSKLLNSKLIRVDYNSILIIYSRYSPETRLDSEYILNPFLKDKASILSEVFKKQKF